MTEYREDPVKGFIDSMTILLMKYGVPSDVARSELYMQLHNVEIIPKVTDLVPYQGDVNEALLKRFIIAKKIKGCTDRTLKRYYSSLKLILAAIGKPATQIQPEDVQYYIAVSMRRGLAKQTIDGNRLAMSSFYAWCQREGIVSVNPMERVDKIKYQPRKEDAFTDDEIEKMRAALRNWRERAIFEALLSTGCRVSELANIMLDDISGEEITVLGEGETYRKVYLNAKASLAVQRYLAERNDGNPYLFPACAYNTDASRSTDGETHFCHAVKEKLGSASPDNMRSWYKVREFVDPKKQISIHVIRQTMQHIATIAGVDNVHPHRFRRTCATMALQRGMPLELVSKMLGHNQLDTTKIYLTLNEEDLRQAHKKYVT